MKKIKNEKIKQNQGITLVALVVTIIVLLILAGVSIGLVFNSEGLFSNANDAVSKYNQSKEEEEGYLQGAEEHFDRYNSIYGGSTTGTPNPTGTASPTPEPTPALPPKGEEPPEEGWTVEQAKALVSRDGLQAHLGEKVAYNPEQDTIGVYRIFYYDNEINSEDSSKGYFGDPLGTLYLKRDFVSDDTTLTSHVKHISSDGGILMRKMNPKWTVATNGEIINGHDNEHCVSWLCDPAVWTKYKIEGVADYAIGSPSVEMYMKAYNVYKDNNPNSKTLVNKIGGATRRGYCVGVNDKYLYMGDKTDSGKIEAGKNNIFIEKWWWLASPSCYAANCICYVYSGYAQITYYNDTGKNGVCPIVAISK